MNQNILLPKLAIPNRYEVHLDVDLENFIYNGSETIFIEVVEDTTELQLHSVGLTINNCFVENDNGTHIDGSVTYLKDDEKILLTFEESIETGDWKLYVDFTGNVVDDLRGFYRSKFIDKNDEEKWIATTQFEPTAARMAFPCWDEPEYKSVFSITLTSNESDTRISNEAVLSESSKDGRTTTKFVDSMRMSTYLVAFIVGPLEVTEIGKSTSTNVRVVHRPGFSHQTKFAGEAAIKILDFFENYYDIKYPGSKLDLIAIPDFAMGAMENVGAVTFRETLLLIDVEKATRAELSRSVEVVAHELAHMWFGDLVTMKWWDGIWLNEAFASLMEVIASEATYPEFKLWNELNLARSQGFNVDSLKSSRPVEFEVATPEEAEEMFDVLTYQKGSTVLRMFETFIGEENFKAGVRNYLKKYQYKNTHSTDLWNELTETSEYEINKILPTWIKQEGYPIVSVEIQDASLKLSQRKFLIDGSTDDSLWHIPINLRYLDTKSENKLLLESESENFEKKGSVPYINNGGWAFFHTAYSSELLQEISLYFKELDINEKYRLLEDSWMSLRINQIPLDDFMDLLMLYKHEKDKNIWALVSGIFSTMYKIYPDQNLGIFIGRFCKPSLEVLGKEYNENSSQEESQLRSIVCGLYAKYSNDKEFNNYFVDLFETNKYEEYNDGNYYNLVLSIAGMDPSVSVTKYLDKFIQAETPQIEGRYRSMLWGLSDPKTPEVVLNAILEGTIRGADAPYIVSGLISHTENGEAAWVAVKDNWDNLLKVMPEWTSSRILDGLPSIYNEVLGKDIEKFVESNPLPSAEKITKQKIERLNANIKFKNLIINSLKKTRFE